MFNSKAKKFVTGRKGVLINLERVFENNSLPVAWFHVASLGEFEQAKPVLEAFRQSYPDHKILITFFSPSGYELRKNYEGADLVTYLPLDTRSNARAFIKAVSPSIIVFVKYEFWYHYLLHARQAQIPLFCISALFTEKHIFFKKHGVLHRKMLTFFDHIFVQNQHSLELLSGIGITKMSISGDTRFDRVTATLKSPEPFPLVEKFLGGSPAIIVGSSWPEDMAFLYPVINDPDNRYKFIIAPHEVGEQSVSQLEKGLDRTHTRISQTNESEVDKAEVLIIDTIGMLSSLYQYGAFAYIGGAFGDGLHNILEAVTFGLPVVFGNQGLEKFPESTELIELGGAFGFNTREELQRIYKRLSTDETFRSEASQVCKKYIIENTGATDKIMTYFRAHYER